MTKRFELKREENKWYFYDNVEEDYIYSKHSVCRLLNHLHQENQSLKESQDVKEFSALFNQTIALKREIKDLKEENEKLKEINKDKEQDVLHLYNENEQLRQQLKQKQEEEKLYAREIVELNKTKNEMLNFKELGGDY